MELYSGCPTLSKVSRGNNHYPTSSDMLPIPTDVMVKCGVWSWPIREGTLSVYVCEREKESVCVCVSHSD